MLVRNFFIYYGVLTFINDFNNYINLLNKDGIMIMHDIKLENSGSKNFWNEIKLKKNFTFKEIVCSKYFFKYGVGILKFK